MAGYSSVKPAETSLTNAPGGIHSIGMDSADVELDYLSPACIIPAAGKSSRMGSWKPLLPWKNGVLCEAVVASVEKAGCRAILVGGYRREELFTLFASRPEVTLVANETWEQGMLGSIQAGAKLVASPGFLVAPADMPFLGPALFRRVVDEAKRRSIEGLPPAAIFAAHLGKLGHPVWIPSEFLSELSKLSPDSKLRDFLLARQNVAVEVGTDAVWIDLDDPETYRRAVESLDSEA